jgi:hypothetical protein
MCARKTAILRQALTTEGPDASAVALAEQRVREMGVNFTVVVGDI